MANSTITAENVYQRFPEIEPLASTSNPGKLSASEGDLSGYDAQQARLMNEVCIVVDSFDTPIARASKHACHLMKNINAGLLHRAFSCFLFNSRNELLLQQRADAKITFPGLWTNTCCSHPLDIPGEVGDDFAGAVEGVKRAAQRKLQQELGIKPEQVPIKDFEFLTRVHYLAVDGKWGEHEVDYILFIRAEVDVDANPNEIKDMRWVSPEQLRGMLEGSSLKYTPWFRLICEGLLFKWWDSLGTPEFDKYKEETEIRRML